MNEQTDIEKNASAEEKIKEAARRVFTQKGYAATRTRDIAEEAGLNLALINYYFRSKEKLFDIIMLEHIQLFVHSIMGLVNDPETTLRQKIEALICHYIDMLVQNPGLPLFVINEINKDPKKLVAKVGVTDMGNSELVIARQWRELAAAKKITINPIHILMNAVSLTIFPFVGSPLIRNRTGIDLEEFNTLMQERKKLIPMWVSGMINLSPSLSKGEGEVM